MNKKMNHSTRTKRKKEKATLGTISHGTLRTEDLFESFLAELQRLTGTQGTKWTRPLNRGERLEAVFEDMFDALNDFAPPYCYFGANPGDGSDFGFWPSETLIEDLKDDEVPIIHDLAHAPKTGLACVLSDHGNVTLYRLSRGKAVCLFSIV